MFFEQVVASDSNLDKIVADFIKVEDQNFALFNYVTEMNNQVEGLQESITKLRSDIKEAKVRYFVAGFHPYSRLMRSSNFGPGITNIETIIMLNMKDTDLKKVKIGTTNKQNRR